MLTLLKQLFDRPPNPRQVDEVIYQWGRDALTWPHLLNGGLLSCGMTGSGKTSTFLLLAHAMLETSDCSFLVLTAKPSDIHDWQRLATRLDRPVEFVHVHPGSGHRINLLDYELNRPGGTVQSAVQFFKMLGDIAARNNSGQQDAAFWSNLFDTLLQAAFTVVKLARPVPTLADVHGLASSLPQTVEQAVSESWTRESKCGQLLAEASRHISTASEERQLRRCIEVILHELPSIGEKGRGAAISMVNGILGKFLAEPWHDMLSSESSNLIPDDLFTGDRGKIVVLDFPVLLWGDAGRFFQILFTMLVQAACLRRDTKVFPRPVVIVRDEVQLYCHGEWDARVLGVARSQKLIHCSLFQTIPTLIGTGFAGTEKARYEAMTFIAGHSNIFCYANSCHETNTHFSELLPKTRKLYFGGGQGNEPAKGFMDELLGIRHRPSVNWHQQLESEVQPSDFLRLRTGGVAHHKLVDAIWFQGGRQFANGKAFRHVLFEQEY